MPYEEDYEKARLYFRDITMAPEEMENPRLRRLTEWAIYGVLILIVVLAAAMILGALGWFFWATWPDLLGNMWPYIE